MALDPNAIAQSSQNPLYQNQLNQMLTNPSSFQGTPGFQFALNTGLDSVNRSNSAMRGSGNALAALTQYGTGLAQQDYGNQEKFLGDMSNSQNQYGLGQGALANTANSNANQYSLGQQQNSNTLALGNAANANTAANNSMNFGLGMYQAGNQYDLGLGGLANQAQSNANTAQNNAWNYNLGVGQNANQSAANQNAFNLGQGQNDINWFGAQTNRGTAESNAYQANQQNMRNWMPYATGKV